MDSLISYKKEFEDYILKQNLDEALKSLVPDSKEYIFLNFCEEYKKCSSEKKISKQLNSLINQAKKISFDFAKKLEIKKYLLEYDLPSTNNKKKIKLLMNYFQLIAVKIQIIILHIL